MRLDVSGKSTPRCTLPLYPPIFRELDKSVKVSLSSDFWRKDRDDATSFYRFQSPPKIDNFCFETLRLSLSYIDPSCRQRTRHFLLAQSSHFNNVIKGIVRAWSENGVASVLRYE